MQLVMTGSAGDGFTYNYDYSIPFEHESAESAIVALENLLKGAIAAMKPTFVFAGREYFISLFSEGEDSFALPDIYTLEEWFNKFK